MNLSKTRQWTVPSSTRDETYAVQRWPEAVPGEDIWTCECIGYRIRSADQHNYTCRHIQHIQEEVLEEFKSILLYNTKA